MTLKLIINNQDVAPLLTSPPVITDQIDAVCRTLEFTLQATDSLSNYLGQAVQLYLGGERWFYGFLEVRGWESSGQITYKVYDPLYFLKKNPYDYYFKAITADQIAAEVCSVTGVKVGSLAPTGYVLPAKLYQKTEGDKVITDALYLTKQATGRAFWYRFSPAEGAAFGTQLFERVLPDRIWAFQRGVNLTGARYEESLEEHYNVVRLVNRETGKTVTKLDEQAVLDFGARTYFDEVDKDAADTMDQTAAQLLTEKNTVKTSISLEGINRGLAMGQFFTGDAIYVEEDQTGTFGAYYVKNVTQTILGGKDVQLAFDVETDPSNKRVTIKQPKQAGKKSSKKAKDSSTTPGNYSPEMKTLMEKYGLNK